MATLMQDEQFQNNMKTYIGYGGTEKEFKDAVANKITTGAVSNVDVHKESSYLGGDGTWWNHLKISIPGQDSTNAVVGHNRTVSEDVKQRIEQIVGNNPQDKWMCMIEGVPYIYWENDWRPFDNNSSSGTNAGYNSLKNKYLAALRKYKTGGIADFTGPAWLDGTPSKPEYVLNSAQTERFFSLIDVLEKYDTDESK
jgi:hypothetical protein